MYYPSIAPRMCTLDIYRAHSVSCLLAPTASVLRCTIGTAAERVKRGSPYAWQDSHDGVVNLSRTPKYSTTKNMIYTYHPSMAIEADLAF